jgi:hypothetical protein
MGESQLGCVQGNARGSADIWHGAAADRSVVDPFAAERSAAFSKVDADLVCTTGLGAALDQREVPQSFDDADVSDGQFA